MNIKEKIDKLDKEVAGGVIAGGVSCGFLGSHVGIAALGLAFPGTIPLAIVGAGIGALGVLTYRGFKKK